MQRQGHQVILVSSGAVGVGCARLGIVQRPKTIALKQAVAAVGQGRLMRVYDDFFSELTQPIAQVLLTRSDLAQRSRYVNSYRTFRQLMQLGVIPIVNENDTVAIDELKFGDNDKLAALTAALLRVNLLVLASDINGLYSSDPKADPQAQLIEIVDDVDRVRHLAGDSRSAHGTGGMRSKLTAAEICSRAGIEMWIVNGREERFVARALAGELSFTRFKAGVAS